MKSKIKWIIFSLLSFQVLANEIIIKKLSRDKNIINEYLSIHQKFFKYSCSKGEEHKYFNLYRDFRGSGVYIPVTSEDHLDVETIKKHLPKIDEKIVWIEDNLSKIKKISKVPNVDNQIKKINLIIERLLNFKERFYKKSKELKKSLIISLSRKEMENLKIEFEKLVSELFFIQSFEMPVNHLKLRISYDQFKDSKNPNEKLKANDIYFYRKIVQDGAQNLNHKSSDKNLRAVIDTILIELNNNYNFLPEDLRYDIESILVESRRVNTISGQLRLTKKKLIERFEEWLERTKNVKKFYLSLMETKDGQLVETSQTATMLKKLANARYQLKEYNYLQLQKVYEFWQKQPEMMKALFAIETILFNEVGDFDGKAALERRDVVKVVINRFKSKFFSSISKDEDFYSYINKNLKDEEIAQEKWLNLLFKTGEFSFTLYFITGSVKIYCPDMSRRGRVLRSENLKLALEGLSNFDDQFLATRYFSRASMYGRVNMLHVWDDYSPVPEREGNKIYKSRSILKKYKKGDYRYLYHFVNRYGRNLDVVEINDKIYAIGKNSRGLEVFSYRNPHFFRYFKPIYQKE